LREYSIPHLRRSGKISIPEESFERIRQARDLHKEGLGTGSVRRLLREGGVPNAGELHERLDQLSESLEKLRSQERPAKDEAFLSHAIRTILARQNLLISAMFNLTQMVEEILIASGKPRKAVFDDDVEDAFKEVAHERSLRRQLETPKGAAAFAEPTVGAHYLDRLSLSYTTGRGAGFGSLARRRRRGILVVLSALVVLLLLAWALPTMGSELASGVPFFDAPKAGGTPADLPTNPPPGTRKPRRIVRPAAKRGGPGRQAREMWAGSRCPTSPMAALSGPCGASPEPGSR
jgi:hypothetical protein